MSGDVYAPKIKAKKMSFAGCPSLSLVLTNLLNRSEAQSLEWLDQTMLYSNLFALPIDNATLLFSIMQQMLDVLPWQQQVDTRNLLLRLIAHYADEGLRLPVMCLRVLPRLVTYDDKGIYELATRSAIRAIMSGNDQLIEGGIKLADLLCRAQNDEKSRESFLEATTMMVESLHPQVYLAGLELLKDFVDNGYVKAYEQAINAVDLIVKDEGNRVHHIRLKILKALIDSNYTKAYERAFNSALEILETGDQSLYEYTFNVIESLLSKKDENIGNRAAHLAAKWVVDKSQEVSKRGFVLFQKLFKTQCGYEQTKEVIEKMRNSSDSHIHFIGDALMEMLEESPQDW